VIIQEVGFSTPTPHRYSHVVHISYNIENPDFNIRTFLSRMAQA
jgi:hypothetical protein